jgi:hypothetical protein
VWRQNDSGDWFQFRVDDEGWALPDHRDAYMAGRAFFAQAQEHGVQLGRPPVGGTDEVVEAGAAEGGEPPI